MRSRGSALSVGVGAREPDGRAGLVRGGLAFPGAGSNHGPIWRRMFWSFAPAGWDRISNAVTACVRGCWRGLISPFNFNRQNLIN